MTTTPYASLPPSEVGAVGESVLAWLHRLAQLPPERPASEALQRLRYELDLPGDDFRRCMLQRLRGLLLLEPADALRIAHASEDAAGTLDE